MHEALKIVDIVALPSLSEGFPLAVLEAMAAGTAVVTTPVGGVPEAVADGRTGLLVPPANADALTAALLRLIESPTLRDEMAVAGRKVVEQQYAIGVFVRGVQDVYDGLFEPRVNGPRRAPAPVS